jgi:preprotein translocase subunit SecD
VAPPSGSASRPGRLLAGLVALIVVLFIAVVGGNIGSPGAWGHDFKVKLGLDLQGGTEVTLKAVVPKGKPITQPEMTTAIAIMENRVNGAGFTEAQVQQQGSNLINVSVPGKNAQQVRALVSTTAELFFRQVLLLAPNTPLPTTPTPSPTPSSPAGSSPSTSPSAPPSGTPSPSSSAHAASLPGAQPGGAAQMASRAHRLRAAAAASPSPSAPASASATPSPSSSAAASPASTAGGTPSPAATSSSGTSTWQQAGGDPARVSPGVKVLFDKLNCADKNWRQKIGYTAADWNDPKKQIVSCGLLNGTSGVWQKFVLDKSTVLGTMVTGASAVPNPNNANTWLVNLTLNGAGAAAFGSLTTTMANTYGAGGSASSPLDYLAVELDGQVVSYPAIDQGPITGGQAQITGSFTQAQATTLANQLSYGHLPLSFTQESVNSVSPQLGHDQLTAGLIAAGLGLILVVFYLLFYYRGLAVIAVSSLIIAAALTYEAVLVLGKYQGFALNLAGVAGLIVAIGITADSFVVFFERLRDEVRDGGKSLRSAVERGWRRARRTILVSDTVSFIAAALLYYFAIGEVRGFAFTLGLTTIIDVVVVFTFTKPMMTLLARTRFYGGGHKLSGLDPARLGARAPWRASQRTPRPAPAHASRPPAPKEA